MEIAKIIAGGFLYLFIFCVIEMSVYLYCRNVYIVIDEIRKKKFLNVNFPLRVVGIFFFFPLGMLMGVFPMKPKQKQVNKDGI
jgi:hypothetical protein